MRTRRNAREAALQSLYQCDSLEDWSDETVDLFFQSFTQEHLAEKASQVEENYQFARKLIFGVREFLAFLDEHISQASTHWNLERMSRVDRNILRLAAFELAFCDEVPINVSINEAIEIAKRFAADDSPMFINGVLDNLAGIFKRHGDRIEKAKQNGSPDDAVMNS